RERGWSAQRAPCPPVRHPCAPAVAGGHLPDQRQAGTRVDAEDVEASDLIPRDSELSESGAGRHAERGPRAPTAAGGFLPAVPEPAVGSRREQLEPSVEVPSHREHAELHAEDRRSEIGEGSPAATGLLRAQPHARGRALWSLVCECEHVE